MLKPRLPGEFACTEFGIGEFAIDGGRYIRASGLGITSSASAALKSQSLLFGRFQTEGFATVVLRANRFVNSVSYARASSTTVVHGQRVELTEVAATGLAVTSPSGVAVILSALFARGASSVELPASVTHQVVMHAFGQVSTGLVPQTVWNVGIAAVGSGVLVPDVVVLESGEVHAQGEGVLTWIGRSPKVTEMGPGWETVIRPYENRTIERPEELREAVRAEEIRLVVWK
jgi:hypothetical protein